MAKETVKLKNASGHVESFEKSHAERILAVESGRSTPGWALNDSKYIYSDGKIREKPGTTDSGK